MKNSNFKENVNYIINKRPFIEVRKNLINFGLGNNLESSAKVCNILHEINETRITTWIEREEAKRADK